jgi:hypothetical protein
MANINRDSLHRNPPGRSLRIRGPKAEAPGDKNTPNQITDPDTWDEIAKHTSLGQADQDARDKRLAQDAAELHGQQPTRAAPSRSAPHTGFNALQLSSVTTQRRMQMPDAQTLRAEDVNFTRYSGGGDIRTWIAEACKAAGLQVNDEWVNGFLTLCLRESSYDPNAVNTHDYNARGPAAGDGHPQDCSRGLAQVIPPTFAAYHVAGTPAAIYHPVANIAAASRYIRERYQVSLNGSDFAAKVQQADPHRPPKGY